MNDTSRIVDEIRALLQASDQSFKPRLKELAAEYAEACAEVNRRFARCAQLIKQGLRGEAIHQAESDPNLLAALAELDFPERTAWLDLVGIYDLPSPPDLDMANAEHLNSAYAEHDPLKDLMKKHRRLALARAPMRERLAVLRDLSRIDPTSPIWGEDVKAYEVERFKQMQAEAAAAARRADPFAADALENELDGVPWLSPLPGTLVRAVRRAAETVRQEAALRALPEIEAELNAAFSALDPAQGRQARARWVAQAETARLPGDHPVRERVEPALLWIDEQDRREAARREFDAAVAELKEAIDDPTAPEGELRDLWQALNKLGHDIPGPLAQRFEQRVESFALASKQRTRLIFGSVAAVAAILLVSVSAGYLNYSGRQERLAAATLIGAALDEGNIEDLNALLGQLRARQPSVLGSAELQPLMPRAKRAQDEETLRARNFARLITEAQSAALSGAEPEPLKAARKLARTGPEKVNVEVAAREIAQRNSDEAGRRDTELAPVFEEVGRAVEEIAGSLRGAVGGDPELSRRIFAVARQLNRAAPATGPLSPNARTRIEQLRSRLGAVAQQAAQATRRVQAAEGLTEAVRRLPQGVHAYIGAAEKLKAEYVQEVQEAEIGKLLTDPERTTWESALLWSAQAAEWGANPTPLDPDTARSRVETCKAFLREYPRCPDSAAVRQYVAYLEAIAARNEPEGGLRAKLKKVLASPSIHNLYMIRYKTNPRDQRGSLRYYSQVQPRLTGTLQLLCLLDTDGTTKTCTLVDSLIVGPRDLSPQSKHAQRIRVALDDDQVQTGWDETLLDAARKVAEDPEMDPVCKLLFLDQLLKTAAEGSLALRESLSPLFQALSRAPQFRFVQWLDPESMFSEKRAESEEIIKTLPSWDQIAMATRRANARLLRSVGETPRPVGWVSRKSPGFAIRFTDPKTVAGDMPLFVALPERGNGVWKPLGRVINSAGDLVLQDPTRAAEGRLVFTRPGSVASDAKSIRSDGR